MVVAASTKASVSDILDQELKADFMISDLSYGPLPAGYLDQISDLDGLNVMPLSMLPGRIEGLDQDQAAAAADGTLGVTPAAVFADAVSVEITQGSLANFDGAVAMGKDYAAKHGFKAGDLLSLVLAPNTPFETTVSAPLAMVIDSTAMSVNVELSDTLVEASLDPEALRQLLATVQVAVTLEPGESASAARQQLVDAAKPFYTITVMDQSDFTGSIAAQVDQILNIIYALLALSVVIAVLGIVNTLALSVIERTREIGLMRAVGLGRGQLSLVMVFEGVLIALFGAVLGLVLGVGLAALLPQVFSSMGLSSLVVPWPTLAGLLGLAALVGVLAAVWPAIRAARLPVLQAVSYE
jgi:putative ABC transport system permease protein